MALSDPISDYLTQIRNATKARHSKVDIPASNIIKEMTKILQDEGYIRSFTFIDDNKQGKVRIYLKYGENQKSTIIGLKRVSRPGYRRYAKVDKIPRVLNGLGIAVLSTPKGILTNKQARKENVGGEILCYVW
jgi:small subunit ribosomal protein S8